MCINVFNWIAVRIDEPRPFVKIIVKEGISLNDWRINSGVVAVTEEGGNYIFEGMSGSKYICPKGKEFKCSTIDQVYDVMKERCTIIDGADVHKYLI